MITASLLAFFYIIDTSLEPPADAHRFAEEYAAFDTLIYYSIDFHRNRKT